MAYGKIKSDALIYDNSGSDVEITISTIPTAAQVAAKAGLDAAQTFTAAQRGDITELTGTSFTLDLNASNNFKLSPSGTFTVALSNLATAAEGQTGSIFIVYAGTESGSFPTTMKFVGGAAGITLTSTAGAVDRIDYIVMNSTTVTCNVTANYVA